MYIHSQQLTMAPEVRDTQQSVCMWAPNHTVPSVGKVCTRRAPIEYVYTRIVHMYMYYWQACTYTLYTVCIILYTVHIILYTVHIILYTVHIILYTVHIILYTVRIILYAVHISRDDSTQGNYTSRQPFIPVKYT